MKSKHIFVVYEKELTENSDKEWTTVCAFDTELEAKKYIAFQKKIGIDFGYRKKYAYRWEAIYFYYY